VYNIRDLSYPGLSSDRGPFHRIFDRPPPPNTILVLPPSLSSRVPPFLYKTVLSWPVLFPLPPCCSKNSLLSRTLFHSFSRIFFFPCAFTRVGCHPRSAAVFTAPPDPQPPFSPMETWPTLAVFLRLYMVSVRIPRFPLSRESIPLSFSFFFSHFPLERRLLFVEDYTRPLKPSFPSSRASFDLLFPSSPPIFSSISGTLSLSFPAFPSHLETPGLC